MNNSIGTERLHKIDRFVSANPILRLVFSHTLFAFFYGIFLFLYEIKFLREIIPVVHPFLIFWAGIIIVYDLFIRHIWQKVPFWKPLALFLVSAAITAALTAEAGLMSNVKAWIFTALPLFVFYPICLVCEKNKAKKTLIVSTIGSSIVVFLASLSAIIMYLIRFSKTVVFMGIEHTLGFVHYIPNDPKSGVILYGAYIDTNHASIYAMVFTCLSVLLYVFCKNGIFEKKWLNKLGKIYAITNICVQLCYFPLANSRGGWLSLGIALFISSALYFRFAKLKISSKFKKSCLSILLAIVCAVTSVSGLLLLRFGVSKSAVVIDNIIEMVSMDDTQSDQEDQKDKEWPSVDKFNKTDDGSGAGRLDIWKETLDLYIRRPVFGVGPGNTEYYGMKYDIAGTKIKHGADVHNSFLDLLTEYGMIGFALLAWFWIRCVAAVMKDMVKNGANRKLSHFVSAFTVLFICGGSAFLSCVFINTTAMYFIMLTLTGYLISNLDIKGIAK